MDLGHMDRATATVATSPNGWIRSVSPAFVELVGRNVEQLARLTLADLVHPHDAPVARRLLGDPGTAGFADRAVTRIMVADGSWRSVELTVRTTEDGRRVFTLVPDPAPPTAAAPSSPVAPPPTGWLHGLFERARHRRPDRRGAAIAAVVVFAFLLRSWDLSSLPTGFHGDEGVTGLEANRILSQGSIGPYTGSALGQPTGPFYLVALAVGLFGETIWATRIMSAVAGAVTVAVTYRIVQRRFDHRTGIASALALATMTWSIHFSRIAFGVAWWPLVVVLAVAAIDRAATDQTRRSWFIAGAVSALGLYVYNSHWGFGPAVIAFVAIWVITRLATGKTVRFDALLFGALGAAIVALPMAQYIVDNDGFFNHFEQVSRRSSREWVEAGALGKLQLHVGWYLDVWRALLWQPVFDGADASGLNRPIPTVFVLGAVVGLVELLRRRRTTFLAMTVATLVLLPVTTALTYDAVNRRTYALAPLIAILVGVGAIKLIDLISAATESRYSAVASAAAIVVLGVIAGVVPYFTAFRNSDANRGVFAHELTVAATAIDRAGQDDPVYVNWFSPRHAFDYPTLEFLLDGTPGETRAELGQGFIPDLDLSPSGDARSADQIFVMIGPYADELGRLEAVNPGGSVLLDRTDPRIVIYATD